jgi:hypothetical protein
MPPEVARAYRDPLDLDELFATDVFTEQDRFAVRDELLRRLVGKYGNAEIESGSKFSTVKQRVGRFRKNPWNGINLLMSVPEYGGKDAVKLELAHVMQPYWGKWWDGFEWIDVGSIRNWRDTAAIVIGDRQFRWLAAQYARYVLDTDRSVRAASLKAIKAAEAYAVDPSIENRVRMQDARSFLDGPAFEAASYYGYDALSSGGNAAVDTVLSAVDAVLSAVSFAEPSVDVEFVYARLAELTRRLITPTLITSASRGLR